MKAATPTKKGKTANDLPAQIRVGPAPHLGHSGQTTHRMMCDVLIGLAPVLAMAIYVFRWHGVWQLGLSTLSCLLVEAGCAKWRRRPLRLSDGSAAVTGVILGLSLPWSAPWYVPVIAGMVAIGLAKMLFGGLGQNIFNPAMVGRAFVLICFPVALGASAYQSDNSTIDILTQATPLTAAKQLGRSTALWPQIIGSVNGSLGETSALACLLGGFYLCIRRAASWQIPASMLLTVASLSAIAQAFGAQQTLGHHLFGGALLFGAFFIATDPVSSPLTPKGKWLFGAGIGALVLFIRNFSGYPEGVMFAVLLMNALVPLINRWTIPRPVGGPTPQS